jgi:dTDP-L-rhamnose 4-epimerase
LVHLAAEVGVGQSMYAIDRYVATNDCGTAVLLQALVDHRVAHRVARVVVASSMSIYGEGLYQTEAGAIVDDAVRRPGLDLGWNPCGPAGEMLTPLATPEAKRPSLASVYAITKYTQERLVLTVAPPYGMEAVALRLFNVYGAGQALSNPYTGVLAIFASRLLHNQRPLVFEDGRQRRDFVHVDDVVSAFVLALESETASGGVFNIGSGRSVTVSEVARSFAVAMGRPELTPEITNKARTGDIRHCFADITLAQRILGYTPRRSFADSFGELAEWVSRQQSVDRVADARRELEVRGLVA